MWCCALWSKSPHYAQISGRFQLTHMALLLPVCSSVRRDESSPAPSTSSHDEAICSINAVLIRILQSPLLYKSQDSVDDEAM